MTSIACRICRRSLNVVRHVAKASPAQPLGSLGPGVVWSARNWQNHQGIIHWEFQEYSPRNMVGTSNLDSWNGHWIMDIPGAFEMLMVTLNLPAISSMAGLGNPSKVEAKFAENIIKLNGGFSRIRHVLMPPEGNPNPYPVIEYVILIGFLHLLPIV